MPTSSMASTGDDEGSSSLEFTTRHTSLSPSPTPPPSSASASVATGVAATSSSTGRSGSRGPIGPKPGVFRPCARCRQKKTKCDRLKPTCSNCKKGGAEVLCVYDNDEPTEGVLTSLPPEYVSTEPIGGSNVLPTAATPKGPRRSAGASSPTLSSSRPPSTSPSASMTSSSSPPPPPPPLSPPPPPAEAPRIPSSHAGTEKSLLDQQQPAPASTPASSGRGRRVKASTATSAAIKPSPLRTSSLAVDAARSPSPTSPTRVASTAERPQGDTFSTAPHLATQKPLKRSFKKTAEDVISGLSIKEHEADDIDPKKDDDGASDTPTPAPITPSAPPKSRTATLTSGSVNGGGGGGGSGGSKAVTDLAAAAARAPPPALPLVIDTNQRARKWDRSRVMFRTLGGEVGLPLWISDQEMLLNDPKQVIFVDHEQLIQQHQKERALSLTASSSGAGGSSGGSGRGGASLSRLAALKQFDHHHRHRTATPDRGNSPESNESTPAPTQAPKKRRGRKHHQGSIDSSVRSMVDSDLDMLGGGDDGDEGERTGDETSILSIHQKQRQLHHHHRRRSKKKRRLLEEGESVDTLGGRGAGSTKGKGSRAPRISQHGPSPRPRTFKCSYPDCPKSFMDQVQLDRHERRHGTDDFECGIDGCTKMYSSISTMRRHQSMVHKRRQQPIVRAREGAIPFTASAVLRKRALHGTSSSTTDEGGRESSVAFHEDEDEDDEDDEDEDEDDDDDEDDEEEYEEDVVVGDDDQDQDEGEGDGSTTAGCSPRRPTSYSAGSSAPSSPLHSSGMSSGGGGGGGGGHSKMAHLLNAPEPVSPLSSHPPAGGDAGDDNTMAFEPPAPLSVTSTPGSHSAESSMLLDHD